MVALSEKGERAFGQSYNGGEKPKRWPSQANSTPAGKSAECRA
jgi:hypothetical protein